MTTEYFNGVILPQNQEQLTILDTNLESRNETITTNTTTTITPSEGKVGIYSCTITTNVPPNIKKINGFKFTSTEDNTTKYWSGSFNQFYPYQIGYHFNAAWVIIVRSTEIEAKIVTNFTVTENNTYGFPMLENTIQFTTYDQTPETTEISEGTFKNSLPAYSFVGIYPASAIDFVRTN